MKDLLTAYLGAHLLIALGWVAYAIWLQIIERIPALRFGVTWRGRVQFGRALLALAAISWPLAGLLPRHHALPEATVLWKRAEAPRKAAPRAETAPVVPPTAPSAPIPMPVEALVFFILGGGFVVELTLMLRGVRRLRHVLRRALPFRRVGRVTLLAQSALPVPFALRLPGRALIVLPTDLIGRPADLRVALRHEGQHHRHGDGTWAIGLAAGSLLFPLNPFVRLWRRTLQDLHEVACDEALVGRRRLDPQAYGRCLVDVAAAALAQPRSLLPGTASMGSRTKDPVHSKLLLERRLALFKRHERALAVREPRPMLIVLALTLTAASSVLSIAYAAQGARPRGPLSMEEGKALVARIPASPGFKLAMNDRVLERMNRIITDPGRTQSFRDALQRMETHRPLIERHLVAKRFPTELLIVPLVESGFRNLPQQKPERLPSGVVASAGMWMFTKQTARHYGLRVDDKIDDRLDIRKETDAAMRLLGANRERYDDWLLSLAAYNEGEGAVDKAIAAGGTRDAWDLVSKGHLNDYLVYVTAGVILMKNPQLLD